MDRLIEGTALRDKITDTDPNTAIAPTVLSSQYARAALEQSSPHTGMNAVNSMDATIPTAAPMAMTTNTKSARFII